MKQYYPSDHDYWRKRKVKPPEFTTHGTELDIQENLKSPEVKNWRLEGNKLIAETEVGNFVNIIPPDFIMTGVENNRPILKKIEL